MNKKVLSFVIVLVVFSVVSVASAEMITEIQLLVGLGLTSSFDADGGSGTGSQTMQSTNGALVITDVNPSGTMFTKTNFSLTFDDCDGSASAGGTAAASFGSGTWMAELYNPANDGDLVLSISGTVDWYNELETNPNAIDGQGIVTIDVGSVFLNFGYWGLGSSWASGNGKSAIASMISNIAPTPLEDYNSDWSSSNVMLLVYADSSAIPEPATIALLGLGAVALIRKKRA